MHTVTFIKKHSMRMSSFHQGILCFLCRSWRSQLAAKAAAAAAERQQAAAEREMLQEAVLTAAAAEAAAAANKKRTGQAQAAFLDGQVEDKRRVATAERQADREV